MSIYTRLRRQWAVYWPCTGYDDNGKPIHGDPEKIKVRWDDLTQIYTDAKGTQRASNAEVIVPTDKDGNELTLDGFLWKIPGTKSEQEAFQVPDDLTSPDDPASIKGAWLIRLLQITPNLKANKFLRSVML